MTMIHRALLTFHDSDHKDAVFAQPDDDNPDVMSESTMIPTSLWLDMGAPREVTMFIVAGDHLNGMDEEGQRYELSKIKAIDIEADGNALGPDFSGDDPSVPEQC